MISQEGLCIVSGGPQPIDGRIGTSIQVTSLLLQQARPGTLGTGGKMTQLGSLPRSRCPDGLNREGHIRLFPERLPEWECPCPQGLSVPGSFLTVEEVSWVCMLAEFHNRVHRW